MTTQTEPKYLYHYTSQKGLLGILKDNKLWMTDILYLNDSSECIHTLNLFISELEKRKEHLPPQRGLLNSTNTQEDDIINKKHRTFERIKRLCETYNDNNYENRIENYIFSLSRKKDDLSQWRSYCPSEGGFSIGFNYKKLLSIILYKHKGYLIQKCEYNPEEKQKLINLLLDPISSDLESGIDIDIPLNIFIQIIFHSSFLKDKSFEDEQEYRIINNGINVDEISRHREGKSMMIPYIEFSPVDDDNKLPISTIWVGPTPHKELSKLSVRKLLDKYGYETVEVETSEIPYRPL
jgi:hypothetical protein